MVWDRKSSPGHRRRSAKGCFLDLSSTVSPKLRIIRWVGIVSFMNVGRTGLVFLFLLLAGLSGCATLQPPGATGPRGTDYPLFYETDDARRNSTTSAISRLLSPAPNSTENPVTLNPLTLTVDNLPGGNRQPAYLPKLGTAPQMSEEETRESLRRFIRD